MVLDFFILDFYRGIGGRLRGRVLSNLNPTIYKFILEMARKSVFNSYILLQKRNESDEERRNRSILWKI